ncbi:dedicator of cytokinesis protein 2-like isoform X2 [Ischnura elegans]|nr:dedicator of cytokinesis protein 2-like isoform X2 [Ischnura elegans]
MGIFPKAYVRLLGATDLLERHKHKNGIGGKLPYSIFNEIVPVLKEWNAEWKKLYVKRDKNISKVKDIMHELIIYCKNILSGRLTKHLMSELKFLIVSAIDIGNRMLGLDRVARDEDGNMLTANNTSSAMKLFIGHELASPRLTQSLQASTLLTPMKNFKEDRKHHSYDLMVSFMNFICIAEGDFELVLTLYDAIGDCPVSDNFVFFWRPNNNPEESAVLQQIKLLFTDLIQDDIKKKQIHLVCYVIRVDSVEQRRNEMVESLEHEASSDATVAIKSVNKRSRVKCKRRPYGVAAVDVSSYLSICAEVRGEDHIFLPFLRHSRGSMRCLLNHIISIKTMAMDECGGCGLWFKLKLFNRDPTKVIWMNNSSMEDVIEIQKIGFPEVIMPASKRNELFLTLIGGEFSRFLTPEKNVEVAMSVCTEDGTSIPGIIQMGNHCLTEYRSLIYYRESKPEWHETIKINLPNSGFKGCHLKFTFTHRSAIFGAEKPFGMSFMNLMMEFGSFISDGRHALNVFMIDFKKFEGDSCPYLHLPTKSIDTDIKRLNAKGLKLSEKCKFFIHTNVCSTKLTQNVSLSRLLEWRCGDHVLLDTLRGFLRVDGGEIVKFLPNILDTLFSILEESVDLRNYGVIIFDCLVYVLDTLADEKYKHFLPVLNLYIEERFNAPDVYKKLIAILNLRLSDQSLPFISKVDILKSLKTYGIFILKSKKLSESFNNRLQEMEDTEGLIVAMKDVINAVVSVCHSGALDRKTQGICLKYCYPLIFMIEDTWKSKELAAEWCKQCCKLKNFIKSFGILSAQDNIKIINEIIESKIFLLPKWRRILTPVLLEKLMEYLNASTEVELCLCGLSGLLEPPELLQFDENEFQHRATSGMMLSLLENVIEAIKRFTRRSVATGPLVALMIEILRQISSDTFLCYQNHFSTDEELLFFLMALIIFFKEIVSRPFFPSDWHEMIMLQNSAILKTLKCISCTIKDKFLEPIHKQIWINYFSLGVTFITQPFLQLETFSEKKSSHMLTCYQDMRLEMACLMKDMWFALGAQRDLTAFLVTPFLEVALIPNAALQQLIVPLFFDMAHCEFFSSSDRNSPLTKSPGLEKSNFSEFEGEIVDAFDMLINSGNGDDLFLDHLCSILKDLFEQSSEAMKIEGLRFVTEMKEQLENLLECRRSMKEGCGENVMICLYQLMVLYGRKKYQKLYVQYLGKLCEWHLKLSNYAEAALTLSQHAQLLDWSCDAVPNALRCSRHPSAETCFQLKEILYYDILNYLDSGRMWLCAVNFCQDLIEVYEKRVYNYSKLADILRKKSNFYEKIRTETLPEIEYFYVSFSGSEFLSFYRNKTFVFRGNYFEDYRRFCLRIKNQFPEAVVIKGQQGEECSHQSSQYIEIIKMYPTFDENEQVLHAQGPTLYHLQEHKVQKFRFSSFKYNCKYAQYDELDVSGTGGVGFASKVPEEKPLTRFNAVTVVVTNPPFPWYLKMSPIASVYTCEICPLWNAIEEVHGINRSLFGLLPSAAYDCPTTRYIHSKLKEIADVSYVKKLNKDIKALVKENREKLSKLRKLECLLNIQTDLMRVFFDNYEFESLKKLLGYLYKCRDKLASSTGSSVITKCPSAIISSGEMCAAMSQLSGREVPLAAKSLPFKEMKKQASPKSPKLFSLFQEVDCLKDGKFSFPSKVNQSPSPLAGAQQESRKSVFYIPTPGASHGVPSSDVPNAFESSTNSQISSSSNAQIDDRKSLLCDCRVEDLPVDIEFKFHGSELYVLRKQETPSCSAGGMLQDAVNASDKNVPPPLPPKLRSCTKLSPRIPSLGNTKEGGILKNQQFDYENIPKDDTCF